MKVSAGLLMYRIRAGEVEIFLAHPGGPFFAKKDAGAWTIPKGEIDQNEDHLKAAIREFYEETGTLPSGEFLPLGEIKQKGGKTVKAWAFAGEWSDGQKFVCNTFPLEWPPRSGVIVDFPEIDRVGFFPMAQARQKLREAQIPFLDRLLELLKSKG